MKIYRITFLNAYNEKCEKIQGGTIKSITEDFERWMPEGEIISIELIKD